MEALWVRVTPARHPCLTSSIIYRVAYHLPRAHTTQLLVDHITNTGDALRVRLHSAKLVICEEFCRLDGSDMMNQLNFIQVVNFPANHQAPFDLTRTYLSQQHSAFQVSGPLLPPPGK